MVHEFRQIIRSLLRRPALPVIAVLIIALTVGVTTAALAVADAILFRPLPYPSPEQLVRILGFEKSFGRTPLSYVDYLDVRSSQHTFQKTAAYTTDNFNVRVDSQPPKRVAGAVVTADLFLLLEKPAVIGRTFVEDEDRQTGSPIPAVLAAKFWQTTFGGDKNILGRTLTVNDELCHVIGVASPSVEHPRNIDLYLPMSFVSGKPDYNTRADRRFYAIGRLKKGSSERAANEDLNRIAAYLAATYPETNAESAFTASSDLDKDVRQYRGPAYLLLGAAGTLLLIGVVNVISLRWNQLNSRAHEWAIRAAVGATRLRMAASITIEGALITLAGAGLALIITSWARNLTTSLLSSDIARLSRPELDGTALVSTFAIVAGTAFAVGIIPALRFDHAALSAQLGNAGRSLSASKASRRRADWFLIVQIGLSFCFYTVTTLLLLTLSQLNHVHLGFDPHVFTTQISLPPTGYPTPDLQRQFFDRALEELRTMPGVENVAASNAPPFGPVKIRTSYQPAELSRAKTASEQTKVFGEYITPDYFRTLAIPLLQGRAFGTEDMPHSAPVAIIDESFAKRYWPEAKAVGAYLLNPDDPTQRVAIVGVVGPVMHEEVTSGSPAACIYFPMAQRVTPYATLLIRPRPEHEVTAIGPVVAKAVSRVDPNQPIYNLRSMLAAVNSTLQPQRITAYVLVLFAGLALVLMAVGLYGTLGHAVARQKRAFGIRLALGATREHILWSVMSRGIGLATIGIALGMMSTFLLRHVLRAAIPQLSNLKPVVFVGGAGLLLFVAALASWLPAWRASRVNPNAVLSDTT
jgi:putative ABC transport system permease protein